MAEAIDPTPPSILEESDPASPILLVGVAGLQPLRALPYFHWRKAFTPYAANKLFLRDLRQVYYQQGLPGIGDDAGQVGRYLREYAESRGVKRSACFGYSSGGHAALLFGWFMNADEVHVFSPRTHLPTRSRRRLLRYIPGGRWGLFRANARLYFDPRISHAYYDLRPFLAQDNGRTRYHIYYGMRNDEDVANVHRLDDCPQVCLHEYDTDSHYLVRQLRDSGELAMIISEAYKRLSP